MTTSLTDHISFDDLSDDMKLVAQSCGLEVARSLIANCPGIQVYIPRPEHMNDTMRRFIIDRLKGRVATEQEVKALAVELRKSPRYVRQVMRE